MLKSFHCPKCNALLERSGEIVVEGVEMPVFQCDNEACAVAVDFGGEIEQAAYTFAVTPAGEAFDPASDDLPDSLSP